MRAFSITRRLMTAILLIELLAAICISGAALVYERHVRFHSFDVMLRGRADSLLGAVQDAEDAHDNVMLDGTEVNFPKEDIYQVEDEQGRLLGRSSNWRGPDRELLRGRTGESLRFSQQHVHSVCHF